MARPLRIVFYGNRQAGMISLLTALALGHEIVEVWEDYRYGLPGLDQFDLRRRVIRQGDELPTPDGEPDLFLCVHGRRIILRHVLVHFPLGGINLHPFLNKYPGANPVERAISAGESVASVYAHRMEELLDSGEVIASAAVEISTRSGERRLSTVDVYNELYPLYVEVVAMALTQVCEPD